MALTKVQTIGIETGISLTGVTTVTTLTVTSDSTFAGNVSIAGTLTYEDVTNVDSLGIVTARNGIEVGVSPGIAASISPIGNAVFAGVVTATSFSGDGSSLTGIAATNIINTQSISVSGITTVSAGSAAAPSITPSGDSNTGIFFPSADTIAFAEGGAEAARIDSSGRLLIGTSTARGNLEFGGSTGTPTVQIETATQGFNSGLSVINNSSLGHGGRIWIGASYGNSIGGNVRVDYPETYGVLSFVANDGTGFKEGARIAASTDAGTGTGDVPSRLMFSTTADGASSPTERARIDSSGRLLVGTSTARTNVQRTGSSVYTPTVQFETLGNSFPYYSFINNSTAGYDTHLVLGLSSGSSIGSNSIGSNGTGIGQIHFAGNDGTNFVSAASIIAQIDNTPGTNDMPGRLIFGTTADGASYPTERMRITNGGFTKCTSTADYHDANGTYHETRSSTGDWTHYLTNTHGSTPQGTIIRFPSVSPNNTGSFFHFCIDSTTSRFQVYSNGGIANYQSNNANLCDEREKKNIIDLDSTWDCLKNWELKKFHYNEDDDTDDLRYGVIAQQVAPHCPEVITDWVKQRAEDAVLDDDGNVVTPAKEEVTRMAVKEQQMMWMAIKALQEAQTRIETLESANAALEARLTALEGGAE